MSAYSRGEAVPEDDAIVASTISLLESNVYLTPGRYLPLRLGTDLRESEEQRAEATALLGRLTDRIAGLPGELPELKDSVR